MQGFEQVNVKCPFYIESCAKRHTIRCESPIDNVVTKVYFKSTEQERQAFMSKYCNSMSGYAECPYFKATNSKYEETNENEMDGRRGAAPLR